MTNEEREFVAELRKQVAEVRLFPLYVDAEDVRLVALEKLFSIIDRLEAQVKELEREKSELLCPSWMGHGKGCNEAPSVKVLRNNLSALMEAAEKKLSKGHNDTCAFVLIGEDENGNCTCGHSRLSTVAAGINGYWFYQNIPDNPAGT